MKNFKFALKIWFYIAAMMSLILFAFFMLFMDIMQYTNYYWYMKQIFIAIFILVIISSFFVVNYYFNFFGIEIKAKNNLTRNIKIYFAVLWRALVFVIPAVGLIAYIYHGSIGSRIFTIFIEILAGFPAIWWFLNSKKIEIRSCTRH